jgi:hypothetical protein
MVRTPLISPPVSLVIAGMKWKIFHLCPIAQPWRAWRRIALRCNDLGVMLTSAGVNPGSGILIPVNTAGMNPSFGEL